VFHWQLFFEIIRQDHNKKILTRGAHLKQIVHKYCSNGRNCMMTTTNAPPHSLKDSNANPKLEITKGIKVRFLAHSTSRVEGHARALGWEL